MARPKKETGKFVAHQITCPPELWAEFAVLAKEEKGSASGVIQELVRKWVADRKAERAGQELPQVLERLRKLETPDA